MNFTNSARGSSGSKVYSFRRTRTFVARLLIKLGMRCGAWAVVIAPWIANDNRPPEAP